MMHLSFNLCHISVYIFHTYSISFRYMLYSIHISFRYLLYLIHISFRYLLYPIHISFRYLYPMHYTYHLDTCYTCYIRCTTHIIQILVISDALHISFRYLLYPINISFRYLLYPIHISFRYLLYPIHISFRYLLYPIHISFWYLIYPIHISFIYLLYPIHISNTLYSIHISNTCYTGVILISFLLASGGKEYQNIKHDLTSISFTMDKYLAPTPHTEFVGHSVVRPLKLLFVR